MKKVELHITVWLIAILSRGVLGQVSHSIDQAEDLLAVDSFDNEISVRRPILAPPPAFAKVGARLVSAPRTPVKKPEGVVRGPVQSVGLAKAGESAVVHTSRMNLDGSYTFKYETGDGQSRQENGQPSSSGSIVQSGSWSYIGSDGKEYSVEFVADELGYRPIGDHLHPAHREAQRQARQLAENRERTRNQNGRTRENNSRSRNQEERSKNSLLRSRVEEDRSRNRVQLPRRG